MGAQQWWCLGETQGEEEQRTQFVTLNTVSGKGVPTGMPCRSSVKTVMGSQAGPWESAFLDRGTLDAVTLENLRSSRRSHFGDRGWGHSGTVMFIVSVTNREGPAFFSEPDKKPWGFENWSFVLWLMVEHRH